ncbi:small nuclear ribonucleoprotein 35kDa (U11 U12) [Cichlidogyrus casuarinus]|uniref:Small nuclear ribonucleoprotein 35kDa (U11 U12) n=1 Tax=Cichlidogyrus casuarinus TaxID=1844966 RepID=A0ABD2PY99_9PLAT
MGGSGSNGVGQKMEPSQQMYGGYPTGTYMQFGTASMASSSSGWHPLVEGFGEYDPVRASNQDGISRTAHDRAAAKAKDRRYPGPRFLKLAEEFGLSRDSFKEVDSYADERLLRRFLEEVVLNHRRQHCRNCPLINLPKHAITGNHLGYGFVKFHHKSDARYCLDQYRSLLATRRMTHDERKIILENAYAISLKGWKPRRLGGGLGGRKESGQLRFGGISRPFRRPV